MGHEQKSDYRAVLEISDQLLEFAVNPLTTDIQGMAVLSIAISMRRIADALNDMAVDTADIKRNTDR
jgi:hypothetical protein